VWGQHRADKAREGFAPVPSVRAKRRDFARVRLIHPGDTRTPYIRGWLRKEELPLRMTLCDCQQVGRKQKRLPQMSARGALS
jgi:hypothetical protein